MTENPYQPFRRNRGAVGLVSVLALVTLRQDVGEAARADLLASSTAEKRAVPPSGAEAGGQKMKLENYWDKEPRPSKMAALKEFHDAFEPELDKDLRPHLIAEEHIELQAELHLGPRTVIREQLAKELADLVYVCYGTALAYDIDLDEAFEIVHASNMSKRNPDGSVSRREDGKVLKGANYVPPDMSDAVH